MTLLALAGKWDGLGASGSAAPVTSPNNRSCSIMANNASNPNPPPARSRNSRREWQRVGKWGDFGSIDKNKLVQVEEHQAVLYQRARTGVAAVVIEHIQRLPFFLGRG